VQVIAATRAAATTCARARIKRGSAATAAALFGSGAYQHILARSAGANANTVRTNAKHFHDGSLLALFALLNTKKVVHLFT
jgi:phage tail sheath gpL-like